MKSDSDEKQFRQLFHELRHQDERPAPRFAATRQAAAARATSGRHGPTFWRLAIASAALVIVGTGVTLFVHRASTVPQQIVTPETVLPITQWESPTDFLLTAFAVADATQLTTQSNQ
jgi:anti-sigma-K factor RskA